MWQRLITYDEDFIKKYITKMIMIITKWKKTWEILKWQRWRLKKQECIPVGCVPLASMVISREGAVCPAGCASRGGCLPKEGVCVQGGVHPLGPRGRHPPDPEADTPSPKTQRQTPPPPPPSQTQRQTLPSPIPWQTPPAHLHYMLGNTPLPPWTDGRQVEKHYLAPNFVCRQ